MALTDVAPDSSSQAPEAEPTPARWIDRFDRRAVATVTVIGFALPVTFYLWVVAHYSVNVIEGDQWDDVTVIRASYSHLIPWGALWAQHNENRIFFPNLLVIALSRTTHFDIRAEEWLSAALMLAGVTLLILTHKRRSPTVPWLYYCPAVIVMLSITQYGNMLWGFQMAWFLVFLALAATLFLLDRPTLTKIAFVGALLTAVIGSFSSLQGLLIWPVGLVLLYHRRRSWPHWVVWLAVGVASIVLYFHHFNSHIASVGHRGWAFTHPWDSLRFFVFAIGDGFSIQVPANNDYGGYLGIVAFGVILVILGVLAIVTYGLRRDGARGSPIGVALICMGFLFAATITEGRDIFGYWAASASRYTTLDLLVPAGIYLTLLDRPTLWWRTSARVESPPLAGGVGPPDAGPGDPRWIDRVALPVARALIIVMIVVQVAIAIPNGIKGARSNYVYQAQGAKVLRNINHAGNDELVFFLYVFSNAEFIRHQALTLEQHHLSVFADGTQSP
jgi:hypothetical protein